MALKPISTDRIAPAVGPFSAAVDAGEFIFASGQIALDPTTGKLVEGDVREQTKQVFDNIEAVLAAADRTLADIVKTSVFLADMADFAAMNEVYASRIKPPFPARTTVQAAKLPLGALVEIEVVAK